MRLLLISEAPMCANGGGIAQTLYNIFSFLPPKDILCITSDITFKQLPPTEPYTSSYITYKFELISFCNSSIAKYLLPFTQWINYTYCRFKSFERIKERIKNFNPDIIVTCPNGPVDLFMHYKLLKGISIKKVFPYFMDDWMHQIKNKWLKRKIDVLVKKILSENLSWLMISKSLSEIFEERYNIKPLKLLEIHNPVDLSYVPDIKFLQKKSEYTIAYAGSLWPMHYDAFLIMCKAVNILKQKINLIVYTSESQWNWRKKELEPLNVHYGGYIPYTRIHEKLSEADFLLITSSFLKDLYTHSKGSIQTKMTDYLKAGRLIISCGPTYSANNQFIKNYQCGICIETKNVIEAAAELSNILDDVVENKHFILNGFEILKKEFSFEKVHQKLKDFLAA